MQAKHLNTLEFPKVLEQLARYAIFSASKNLAQSLKPTPHFTQACTRQTETTEAIQLLAVKPDITIGGARDVRPIVGRANIGATLSIMDLLTVRQTLIAARDLQRIIVRLAEDYPHLADIAQRIEASPGLVNSIGQAIADNGEVKSKASPTLANIRRELDIIHNRLLDRLKRIISSPHNTRYLQEALITQRGGRYVIPLKAEFKGKIQGVVQDQSASGATLFIEPMSTVELNNQWRQLQLAEAEEIRKILAQLSTMVAEQGRLIKHTVVALADLDLAFAKAKYAQAIDGIEPILYSFQEESSGTETPAKKSPSGGALKLLAARHPLLEPESVVASDIILAKGVKLLVITGPNTGGKTVSLKTVGLLSAMAQAGLRIPAEEGSALPVFNHILADIGDEQSIEQNLSTFSGHMTNVVEILQQCDHHSLVIFDELGAGTDPIEGSALARAILSHLLENQVTTFVATHYSELKAYAHTTAGVANASMEFDLESLAPTYRLQIGLPGASNAFAIVQRLGLSDELINQARGLIGEDVQQVEAMLAEIKAETESAYQIRRQAEEKRSEVADYEKEIQRRLDEIEAERRNILSSARADARREIKAARQEIRRLKEEAEEAVETQLEDAKQAIEETLAIEAIPAAPAVEVEPIDTQLETLAAEIVTKEILAREDKPTSTTKPAPQKKKRGPVRPGDKVFIDQFNTVGEVVGVQNKQVEIQLGHFRTTVPVSNVELREKAAEAKQNQQPERVVNITQAEAPGRGFDLRGQVKEDAVQQNDPNLY
ncbi:MAG: endonuclease MutS2, partial [Chloroflexota bacterium]